MKFKHSLALTFLLSYPASASWTWTDLPLVSGNSGSFSHVSTGTTYDAGNGVNTLGWDRTPEPTLWSWTTTGGEPVSFESGDLLQGSFDFPDTYVIVDLDPDGDDILPTNLIINIAYPFGLNERNIGTGGFGANINPMGTSMTGELEVNYADGTQVVLDNSFGYGTGPASYSGGNAIFNIAGGSPADAQTLGGSGRWYGLFDDGGTGTTFPFANTSTIPADNTLMGSQTWTLSNFSGEEQFRFSTDGGVHSLTERLLVPEPTSSLLSAFGLLMICGRRRR